MSLEKLQRKFLVFLGLEKLEETQEGTEKKLEEFVMGDGTVVVIESLEIGQSVQVKQEDGTFVPSPAATYIMEDGTNIVVDENGIITEIIPPSEEKAEEKKVENEKNLYEERFGLIEKTVEKLIEDYKTIYDRLSAYEKLSTDFTTLSERVETIADQPAPEQKLVKVDNPNKEWTEEERLEAIMKVKNGLKNADWRK